MSSINTIGVRPPPLQPYTVFSQIAILTEKTQFGTERMAGLLTRTPLGPAGPTGPGNPWNTRTDLISAIQQVYKDTSDIMLFSNSQKMFVLEAAIQSSLYLIYSEHIFLQIHRSPQTNPTPSPYCPDYNCTSHSRGFTAPACQDNLWHPDFRLDLALPVGMRERVWEEEGCGGWNFQSTHAQEKETGLYSTTIYINHKDVMMSSLPTEKLSSSELCIG